MSNENPAQNPEYVARIFKEVCAPLAEQLGEEKATIVMDELEKVQKAFEHEDPDVKGGLLWAFIRIVDISTEFSESSFKEESKVDKNLVENEDPWKKF